MGLDVFDVGVNLISLLGRFNIDGTDDLNSATEQAFDEMPPMNPPAPHTVIFWSFCLTRTLHKRLENSFARDLGSRAFNKLQGEP